MMGYFRIYYFSGIYILFLHLNFGNEFRGRKQHVTKNERNKYKRIYPFLDIVYQIWPIKVLSYFVICFCLRGMCRNVAIMGFLQYFSLLILLYNNWPVYLSQIISLFFDEHHLKNNSCQLAVVIIISADTLLR